MPTVAKLIALRLLAPDSPEVTGDYRCPFCGNTEVFTGFDDEGFGGWTYGCDYGSTCVASLEPVTLTQEFTVLGDGLGIDYHCFEGVVGEEAEIGDYTRILCARCDEYIYIEPGYEEYVGELG